MEGEVRDTSDGSKATPGRRRLYRTEGLVLRSVALGEADRIVTVLTPGLGKLRVTVRGARRITSRLGGHLDVLNQVVLSLAQGRQLDVVTGAEARETFRPLKEDLDRLALALYLVELADAFLPEGSPHPDTYAFLVEALRLLGGAADRAVILRYGELRLLADSGFGPELYQCVMCRAEVQPDRHRYAPAVGGVVCDTCVVSQGQLLPLPTTALKVLRFFGRHPLSEALRVRLGPGLDRQVEALLSASIHYVLEREVASAEFIDHLRRLRAGPPRRGSPSP